MSPCAEEYLLRLSSMQLRYYTTAPRRNIIGEKWSTQTLQWSKNLDIDIGLTSTDSSGNSRRLISPNTAAEAAAAQSTVKAKESEQVAEQAAMLSIESSKKSITASKVAVGAGVVAVAAGCTVM